MKDLRIVCPVRFHSVTLMSVLTTEVLTFLQVPFIPHRAKMLPHLGFANADPLRFPAVKC